MKDCCEKKGIKLDFTIPKSQQLNGTAERMNRTLKEKARPLMFDSELDKEMLGEAVMTAAYILNRCPMSTVEVTPAEMWFS